MEIRYSIGGGFFILYFAVQAARNAAALRPQRCWRASCSGRGECGAIWSQRRRRVCDRCGPTSLPSATTE
jgi:hypothetical protein